MQLRGTRGSVLCAFLVISAAWYGIYFCMGDSGCKSVVDGLNGEVSRGGK
jgi:hypothetical protein